MTRPRGGYIGFNRVPAASKLNSAASGVWTLREAEALKRAGTWPIAPPLGFFDNMQLWLDASDSSSVTTASGNVSQWNDKSGNGNHVSQATAANRPAYQTAVVNGLNAINFGGGATSHRLFRSSFTVSQPSIFIVFTIDNNYNDSDTLIQFDTGSGDRCVLAIDLTPKNYVFQRDNLGATSRATVTPIAKNKAVVASCVSEATGHQLWIDGSKGTDATAGAVGFNGISVGNLRGDPSPLVNLPHYGRICELIVYSTKKADTERASIENYLIAKWGIT